MKKQKIIKRIIFAFFFFTKNQIKKIKNCSYIIVYNDLYTGFPILKVAPKYFFSEAFSEKIFQVKVVWVKGEHKKVSLKLVRYH